MKDNHPESDLCSVASGVRLRVLTSLSVVIILLVLAFVALFILDTRKRQVEEFARTAASVENLFKAQTLEGVQVMRSIMELVMGDRRLETALRACDRKTLFDLSEPILKEIRGRNKITHFYYILPDLTTLLRVHIPDQYGDKIDRFGLQEVQRTGKPFWGTEQGPFGTLTLRVTYPWYNSGDLIGYLEMGIDIDCIVQAIHKLLDVDLFLVIDKKFLDKVQWESMQKRRGGQANWDEFPSALVLSRTQSTIPAPLAAYLVGLQEKHRRHTFETAWEGHVAQTIVVPISDLRERGIGEIVALRDITGAALERRQAIIWVATLGTIISGVLMAFFYVLLGRVQKDVVERTARLTEAQRVLTIEQLERLQAESSVRASERKFRAIFDQTFQFIGLLTIDGILVEVNKTALEFAGVIESEVLNKPFWETPWWRHSQEAQEQLRLAISKAAQGDFVRFETIHQDTNGSVHAIDFSIKPVLNDNGEVVLLIPEGRDITERRKTENIIQARLRLSQSALSQSLDDVLQATLDEVEKLTGSQIGFYHFLDADQKTLSLQMWSTRTLQEMCKAEGKGLHYDIAQAGVWVDCVRERRPVIHNEYCTLPHRKGMPSWHAEVVRELVVPVFRGERIVAILGVGNKPNNYDEFDIQTVSFFADLAWDIAERKIAEESLRKSDALLKQTQKITKAGGWEYDVAQGKLAWTEEVFRIYGVSPDTYDPDDVQQNNGFYFSADRAVIAQAFQQAVNEGLPYNLDMQFHNAQGEALWVCTIGLAEMKDGKVVRVFGNIMDITERKRSEKEIRRLNEELQQKIVELIAAQEELVCKEKLAILGQMSGSVGHELRNPLGVMSNAVYFLQMVCADADDTTKEYLGIIKHEIDNSLRIITDLLDFARTKAPQIQAVTARVLVDESLGRCTLPENVALQAEISDNLPLLSIDPLQMGQVLQNLITNAAQAMPAGGELRVTARLVGAMHEPLLQHSKQETSDFIKISVTDTGEGIAPENMNKLFQPLFTTKAKGIGLGLVVCKNLVEANRGWIEVESELGKGTSFTVVLPVQETKSLGTVVL